MFLFLEDLPSTPLSAIDIASTNPSTCTIRSSTCKDFHGMEKKYIYASIYCDFQSYNPNFETKANDKAYYIG